MKSLLLNLDMDLYDKVAKKASQLGVNKTQYIRDTLAKSVESLNVKEKEQESVDALKEVFDIGAFTGLKDGGF